MMTGPEIVQLVGGLIRGWHGGEYRRSAGHGKTLDFICLCFFRVCWLRGELDL